MCYDALDWKEGFVEEKYIDLLQLQKLDFSKDLTDDFGEKMILRVWLKKVMKSLVNF